MSGALPVSRIDLLELAIEADRNDLRGSAFLILNECGLGGGDGSQERAEKHDPLEADAAGRLLNVNQPVDDLVSGRLLRKNDRIQSIHSTALPTNATTEHGLCAVSKVNGPLWGDINAGLSNERCLFTRGTPAAQGSPVVAPVGEPILSSIIET